MTARETVQDRISARMTGLSPVLRNAARFVASHPDEVATRSLRYLANQAELSPPTFSRLASALGFENYEELRNLCRDQIKHRRQIFGDRAHALKTPGGDAADESDFIVRQASAAIGNINELVATADPADMDEAASLLATARKVVLVGTLGARPFVDYVYYMSSFAFDHWRVCGQGSASMASELSGLASSDVVLAITKAHYARYTVEMTEQAHARGAKVIGITDNALSPLAPVSDICFIVEADTPQFFASYVATLVLLESLMGMTVAKAKGAAERIAATEKLVFQTGDCLPS